MIEGQVAGVALDVLYWQIVEWIDWVTDKFGDHGRTTIIFLNGFLTPFTVFSRSNEQ